MLVDGCLLDNVPIRSMHDMKGGPNIVVSFDVPQLERFTVDYQALPSRKDLVRRALVPFRRVPLPDAPGLGSVLMRSLMVNRQDFERHLTPRDLLMVPPLPRDMGILEWSRHTRADGERLPLGHRRKSRACKPKAIPRSPRSERFASPVPSYHGLISRHC